ncbi:MAG TPA: tetratricopeptide repeat protein [Terriglobia bacterium]|nr:tetratricopeptide repeat protein [Terriglobia bacterium]
MNRTLCLLLLVFLFGLDGTRNCQLALPPGACMPVDGPRAFAGALASAEPGGAGAQSTGGSAPQAAAPADLNALLQQAEDALEKKDYQAALAPLQIVVHAAPDRADAWFYLGFTYHGLHQDGDARSAYERATKLNPDLYQAQANLGLLLFAMKDVAGALPHLQKAVALKPGDARPHLDLGVALEASGQTAAAEAELRQALQLDPKLEAAAYQLGKLELDQKQYSAAADDFGRALALNQGRAEAELGLASAYEGLGQASEAEQHFEKYLKLQPVDASVRFHLARLYLQENKADLALTHLQQLAQTHVELPGLDAALGDAYARSGKFSDSESYYRRTLAATPSGPDAAGLHRALATTLVKEGKATEAESEFRAALRLDPNDADASKGLAESLYLQDRWADAAPIIERLVQSPSAPAGLYFFLATCYDHLRDRKRALDAYEQFLQRSNGSNPDQEWQARQRAKLLSRELGKPIR